MINVLIEHKIIIKESTQTHVSETSENSIAIEKRQWGMNLLPLNPIVKEKVDPYLSIFLDTWPSVSSPEVSNESKNNETPFSKGKSKLNLYEARLATLRACTECPLWCNFELYKKTKNLVDYESFQISQSHDLESVMKSILNARLKVNVYKKAQTTVSKIKDLKCI